MPFVIPSQSYRSKIKLKIDQLFQLLIREPLFHTDFIGSSKDPLWIITYMYNFSLLWYVTKDHQ